MANLLMLGEGCDVATLTRGLHSTSQSIRDTEVRRPEEAAMARQLFHADDGAIADHDPEKVQRLTDECAGRFSRVGLKMKDKKTKAMAVEGVKGGVRLATRSRQLQDPQGEGALLQKLSANCVEPCPRSSDCHSTSREKHF